jgi:hypothetical protein
MQGGPKKLDTTRSSRRGGSAPVGKNLLLNPPCCSPLLLSRPAPTKVRTEHRSRQEFKPRIHVSPADFLIITENGALCDVRGQLGLAEFEVPPHYPSHALLVYLNDSDID